MGNQKRDGFPVSLFFFREGRNMEKLRIYRVTDKYIRFLNSRDSRVQFNKNAHRPYVGVVLLVGEHRYFVPMESPKPGHANIKPGVHIFKLAGGSLGLLGFNNMIPVPACALIEFDFSAEPDEKYKRLLQKQLIEIARNRAAILQKASKTYFDVVNKSNSFLIRISCDFKLLERAARFYDPDFHKQKPEA